MSNLTPFQLDVKDELIRIDEIMTEIINDKTRWDKFFSNPLEVLTSYNFISSDHINQTNYNNIFYACISNKRVLELSIDILNGFEESKENKKFHNDGLKKGIIQNLVEHDFSAMDYALYEKFDLVVQLHTEILNDLNNRNLLEKVYSNNEIEDYSYRLVEALKQGLKKSDLPKLSDNGKHLSFFVTVPVLAEAIVAATVVIPVIAIGASLNSEYAINSVKGDIETITKTKLLSNIFGFISELSDRSKNF